MAKKLTKAKAREILHDKEVHGHPLTDKQRRFFGAVSSGYIKAQNGIEGTMGGLTDKGFNFNPAWGGAWKNGGWLEKYADGGILQPPMAGANQTVPMAQTGTRQPIYTSDPRDPRLRNYQDSLNLYKAYQMQDKLMGPGSEPSKYNIEWTTNELKKGRAKEIRKGLEEFGPLSKDFQSEKDQFKEGYNAITSRLEDKKLIDYYKSLGFGPNQIMYHSSPDIVSDEIRAIGTYFDGTAISPIYKKPVQPVVYKKPNYWTEKDVDKSFWASFIKKHPGAIGVDPFHVDKDDYHLPIYPENKKQPKQKLVTRFQKFEDIDLPEEIQFKELPQPRGGYKSSAPEPQMISETPTKYSYTYPSGNEQKTIYFPGKSAWQAFVDQYDGLSTEERAGSFSASPGVYSQMRRPNPIFGNLKFAMGGSLPGSVGFTYARVAGAAPSEGPRAKKTMPSAQNGMEMKYYQEGLDWKPKTISKNGGWLNKFDDGGEIVKDDEGYWNPQNWGKPVEINSNQITMEGVLEPLLGVSDTGDTQMMYPGKNYTFDGTKVVEYPREYFTARDGKSVNRADEYPLEKLDNLFNFTNYNKPTAKNGKWLDKYK